VLNLAGKTTLIDLAELIRAAKLLIGNESGAVHLAAAVGTPSVSIVGGGHYGRFIPYDIAADDECVAPIPVIHRMECYGCNWKCIFPIVPGQPTPCVSRITVQHALTETESICTKLRNNH
jgi:ADP-heptose:LPS heptosyltransferase